jgi:hypothetical protein
MMICSNCLEDGAITKVEVGSEQGHQMDPWRRTLDLCGLCEDALTAGDLQRFHGRYASTRTIERPKRTTPTAG